MFGLHINEHITKYLTEAKNSLNKFLSGRLRETFPFRVTNSIKSRYTLFIVNSN